MIKKKTPLLLIAAMFIPLIATPYIASAEDFNTGEVQECQDESDLGKCVDTNFDFGRGGESENLSGLLQTVITVMAALVGVAVLGGVLFGAVMYATAEGNPAKAAKAVTIIVNSMIGLVTFILMFAAIQFLVPGGVFS